MTDGTAQSVQIPEISESRTQQMIQHNFKYFTTLTDGTQLCLRKLNEQRNLANRRQFSTALKPNRRLKALSVRDQQISEPRTQQTIQHNNNANFLPE